MRVFLCWGKDRSKQIAEAFHQWVPRVLQPIQPFISTRNMLAGKAWLQEIRNEISAGAVGVVFLTPECLTSTMVHYEVGLFHGAFDDKRVIPIVVDMPLSDVKPPLTELHLAEFNKDEMMKVVKALNDLLGERAVDERILEEAFADKWGVLEKQVQAVIKAKPSGAPSRDSSDKIDEILEIVRRTEKREAEPRSVGTLTFTSSENERSLLGRGDYVYRIRLDGTLEDVKPAVTRLVQAFPAGSYTVRESGSSPEETILFFQMPERVNLGEIERTIGDSIIKDITRIGGPRRSTSGV